jgi:hypothetical protein
VSDANTVEAAILRLTAACGPGKSVSPEDVAKALAPGDEAVWRSKLSAVRRVAVRLAGDGRIDILRKGKRVEPEAARGVIRLRAAEAG